MSNNIIYRKPTDSDYVQVQNIIGKSFSLQKYLDKPELLGLAQKAYVEPIKNKSGFHCVAVEDGEVIGIIMASAKNDSSINYDNPEQINMNDGKYAELLTSESLKSYYDVMARYVEYVESRQHEFDGSLTLFAVTEACRGKGVGKALLNKAKEYWKEFDSKYIFLFTDEACNLGFYDHLGFKRLDERTLKIDLKGKEKTMDMYMYGYNV